MKRFTCLIPAVLLGFAPLASPAEPDAESLLRLSNGEILLLDATSNESGGSARVQVLIQSPAEAVWDVITSCEQSFVFVDGLKSCEVIEDSGHRALVRQRVKKGWLIPQQDFVFESRRTPFRNMNFELVEGNLKAMEGSWDFSEIPEGLLVEYQIRVRPAFPVPGFIVSYVMRRGMPDLIACIRGLAGGSGSSEKEKADLGRCRGDAAGSR
ncbi:SRPBCC family protein [Pseudomonadota bacterium]